jgi:glycosyltransferase involved in cell wall biosynthesis
VGLSVSLIAADTVVFLSTEYRDEIKKRLTLFFSNKRTVVIPNGIDLELFKPVQRINHQFIKIGMQSRLSANKDHPTLIDAFALLLKQKNGKPVKLFIAGDGVCRAALEKQVYDLCIDQDVVFTGLLEEAILPEFINSLDVYVHATLGETMSTAIMQVMACGVPVIASDVLGVDNMVRHNENGLLVPVKNAPLLCEAILQLINDPDKATRLANNAFAFAKENYSNKIMLERYNKIFAS